MSVLLYSDFKKNLAFCFLLFSYKGLEILRYQSIHIITPKPHTNIEFYINPPFTPNFKDDRWVEVGIT